CRRGARADPQGARRVGTGGSARARRPAPRWPRATREHDALLLVPRALAELEGADDLVVRGDARVAAEVVDLDSECPALVMQNVEAHHERLGQEAVLEAGELRVRAGDDLLRGHAVRPRTPRRPALSHANVDDRAREPAD